MSQITKVVLPPPHPAHSPQHLSGYPARRYRPAAVGLRPRARVAMAERLPHARAVRRARLRAQVDFGATIDDFVQPSSGGPAVRRATAGGRLMPSALTPSPPPTRTSRWGVPGAALGCPFACAVTGLSAADAPELPARRRRGAARARVKSGRPGAGHTPAPRGAVARGLGLLACAWRGRAAPAVLAVPSGAAGTARAARPLCRPTRRSCCIFGGIFETLTIVKVSKVPSNMHQLLRKARQFRPPGCARLPPQALRPG